MKKVFKYKKMTISLITLTYIILTIIEFVKYFLVDSNLFGMLYMLINAGMIFLIIPVMYNYNKYYSPQRISKLIIFIVLGIFNSYFLSLILKYTMSYNDYSVFFSKDIFMIKNILKGTIYGFLILFTVFEFKLQKLIKKPIKK